MKLRALLAAAALASATVALASWPQPDLTQVSGCTPEVVQFTAFIPYAIQARMADAGLPITPTIIPFKEIRARRWTCNLSDGGSVYYLPRFPRLAEYFRDDLTRVITPCSSGDAGSLCSGSVAAIDNDAIDAFSEQQLSCACSTGSSCTVAGSAAPIGATLAAGTFTGAGCRPKACGTLWIDVTRADGGISHDPSWPPACPIQ